MQRTRQIGTSTDLEWSSLLMPERQESNMAESVYNVIELVRTSNESWEKAAAIEQASQTLRDLRVARVVEQDVHSELR